MIYKVTGAYDRAAERGVIWNDPAWRCPGRSPPGEAVLSDKDKVLPRLADCPVFGLTGSSECGVAAMTGRSW